MMGLADTEFSKRFPMSFKLAHLKNGATHVFDAQAAVPQVRYPAPIRALGGYLDQFGNAIIVEDPSAVMRPERVSIVFRGFGNTLIIKPGADAARLDIDFQGNNARCEIGPNATASRGRWHLTLGDEAEIVLGDDIETGAEAKLVALRQTRILLRKNTVFMAGCHIQAGESPGVHARSTEAPSEPCGDVVVGEGNLFLGSVRIRSGVSIGEGNVVEPDSFIASSLSSGCLVLGNPAEVIGQVVGRAGEQTGSA